MNITPQQLFAFGLASRIKFDGVDQRHGWDDLNDSQRAAWTAMADRYNALVEFADRLAASLADAAGYLGSVRTDRVAEIQGERFALQTVEWAEGAAQYAATATAMLDEHDEAGHVLPIVEAERLLVESRAETAAT